ncbi:hypothetical protein [Lysinibacillus parviboronicapiens]|uniref:hypothetical protein n=1 Tax=Lysinibacillus parviboronicapiens TaxID=436516 RepID=UPI000D35E871|nr:hypothetical protein [Lysinibacillus parviboronicapiens]
MKTNINVFEDEYSKENSNEVVKAVTIVIDGEFKQIVDTIQSVSKQYPNNIEIISNALIYGINKMVLEGKNKK